MNVWKFTFKSDNFLVSSYGYRFFEKIMDALIGGKLREIQRAIDGLINFLMNNAKRSRPKRDRLQGRLQSGLTPIFSLLKN